MQHGCRRHASGTSFCQRPERCHQQCHQGRPPFARRPRNGLHPASKTQYGCQRLHALQASRARHTTAVSAWMRHRHVALTQHTNQCTHTNQWYVGRKDTLLPLPRPWYASGVRPASSATLTRDPQGEGVKRSAERTGGRALTVPCWCLLSCAVLCAGAVGICAGRLAEVAKLRCRSRLLRR